MKFKNIVIALLFLMAAKACAMQEVLLMRLQQQLEKAKLVGSSAITLQVQDVQAVAITLQRQEEIIKDYRSFFDTAIEKNKPFIGTFEQVD